MSLMRSNSVLKTLRKKDEFGALAQKIYAIRKSGNECIIP